MRIALVDDDVQQLDALRLMLSSVLDSLGVELTGMDAFSSAEGFCTAWQPGSYDIILLDIFMGEENGVDLARRIRTQDMDVALAFCTSSNEFASESYEVGAGYYLQKPISPENLTAMVRRLDLARIQRNRLLRLPDGFRCLLRNILYTEYSNHSVTFHIWDGEPHSVYMSHGEAETLLTHYKHFCCINKGSIVNLAMVKKITATEFLMRDGQVLPISRRRYKEVQEAYNRYHFEKLDEEVVL